MAIPNLPNWIGVVLCFVVLAFTAISIVKATAAGDIVSEIDEKVEIKTSLIKALAADAESLMSVAKAPELMTEVKKVYQALRYSDPVSNASLDEINCQVQNQFSVFANAVKSEDSDLTVSSSEELLVLIDERNKKCKLLK